MKHDTYFVQHFLKLLAASFEQRGLHFDWWNISSDGAASHFKNRYTFHSLFEFSTFAKAQEVMWVSADSLYPTILTRCVYILRECLN
jgi:hypothetical protein